MFFFVSDFVSDFVPDFVPAFVPAFVSACWSVPFSSGILSFSRSLFLGIFTRRVIHDNRRMGVIKL